MGRDGGLNKLRIPQIDLPALPNNPKLHPYLPLFASAGRYWFPTACAGKG